MHNNVHYYRKVQDIEQNVRYNAYWKTNQILATILENRLKFDIEK